MADVDLKQKIKEVRDKFLSTNQIDDIRQNITLGVEERLKFLNAEQIQEVALLEKKYEELDRVLQDHVKKTGEERKEIETAFEAKLSDLILKNEEQSINLKGQNTKLQDEQTKLEKLLDEKFQNSLKGQMAFMDDSLAQFAAGQAEFKNYIKAMEQTLSKKVEEQGENFTSFSDNNLLNMESNKIVLLKKLEETDNELSKTVDKKLLTFEQEKKEFLNAASEDLGKIASSLEEKINGFLQNHKTVEEIIDSRLTEFRTAQKAAFEELEAALNLLERHQDDTLTRFRQKSDLTQNRQTNLPNSFIKNRGSILYQSENSSTSSLPIVDDAVETTDKIIVKRSKGKILKTFIFVLVGSLVFIYVSRYFNINYQSLINLSKYLVQ